MRRKSQAVAPFIRVFILAGGASSRMGRDKSALTLGGKSLLEIIRDTALRLNRPVEVIRKDTVPQCGPIGGVFTALQSTDADAALFLSCDMPLVTVRTLRQLIQHYQLRARPIFMEDAGRAGFPFILPTSLLPRVRKLISEGRISLQELAAEAGAELLQVENPAAAEFSNVNTREDFAQVQKAWASIEASRKNTVLEINDLNIRRGATPLVRDFSWKIRKGEHWVMLGPNGSGKTSILSALLGYLTPTGGDIFMLGEEYGQSDWPALRCKIGLVSSTIRQMLPENEPAWITVASGKYAMVDFWGTPKKSERGDALKILRQVHCEYLAERPWAWLSQGERQRVLIGRALMARPAVLILDEPCAGLDPAAREHFLQFLDRFGRGPKSPALVLVTHHVEEIMPVFTHALLLKEGRKMAEGTVEQVVRSAPLTEAFDAPMRVEKKTGRFSLEVAGLTSAKAVL